MKIGEVCEFINISQDTLRYYEKIGLLKDIKRINGIRDYSEVDVILIDFIKAMRDAGLSIQFLINYMNLIREGDSTFAERKQLLIEQKQILLDKMSIIQKSLDKLNYKIKYYEELISKVEEQIASKYAGNEIHSEYKK